MVVAKISVLIFYYGDNNNSCLL